jgi:hypothetical protein
VPLLTEVRELRLPGVKLADLARSPDEHGEPIEVEVLDATEFLARLLAAVEGSKRAKARLDVQA